jgi:hypothetical protein
LKINYPNNDYLNRQNKVRSSLEVAMGRFKDLIKDKIHPSNKTKTYDDTTVDILNNLLVEANELDKINSGEGIFSLIVLSLRTNLKLRDMIIEQEVKIKELELKLKRINRNDNA